MGTSKQDSVKNHARDELIFGFTARRKEVAFAGGQLLAVCTDDSHLAGELRRQY
jgi:hypothetical protein